MDEDEVTNKEPAAKISNNEAVVVDADSAGSETTAR
jgi:hypothetical protein